MDSAKTIYKNMEEVMKDSMIPYSEYVIMDRALPRVEDGLKPVQRRVLYSMMELGITPDKPYKKCARIVGDCLGKFHPHGDTSVYFALVRMAQSFNMGTVLVDGHGNYGSIDGDGPAAMRYTEARLAPLALELIRDLDKDTVHFSPNFDDSLKEPDYLPGRFPNLLVNGATGIAVGLATNIPPHNLGESIDAVSAYIDNPRITLAEMMKYIKGPDFPTGGVIISGDLVTAYETGKGKIKIRAKIHLENDNGKKLIVIDEVPFQVNKAALLESVLSEREADKNGALGAITDITDESDRNGMRAVLKVKPDGDVDKILEILFKKTSLEVSYGINMVAIADGKPQQMGLIDIIAYYVDYQRTVIVRRTKFELEQAKVRAHILEGLLIAVKNIDAVVKVIKTSNSTSEAKEKLRQKFKLSEKQAQAIIDLRLGRLTHMEVYKLEQELAELKKLIDKLTAILGSKKLQMETIKEELEGIKKAYRIPRKSDIIADVSKYKLAKPDEVRENSEYVVAVNEFYIKKMSVKSFNMANKEFGESSTVAEFDNRILKLKAKDKVCLFTDIGNCHKVNVDSIADGRWKENGERVNRCVPALGENEKPVFAVNSEVPQGDVYFFTLKGMVKKTSWSEYTLLKSSYQAAKLSEGDKIISMESVREGNDLIFITKSGMCLRCEVEDIPTQGRISTGVKGIKLASDDVVVYAGQITNDMFVNVVTTKGYAKRVPIKGIDPIGRYGKGVKIIDLKGGSTVAFAAVSAGTVKTVWEFDDDYAMGVTTDNFPVEVRTSAGKALVKNGTIRRVYVYRDELSDV